MGRPSTNKRLCAAGKSVLAIWFVFCVPASPLLAEDKAAVHVGQRLFREGVGREGPLVATVGAGDFPLSGAAIACANCHGADALGRPEGGVTPPAITWQELTKPYGHVHASGRKHKAFNEETFLRAVRDGLDPAGNTLDRSMPRYLLSAHDSAQLVSYLKAIERDIPPGITATSLRLATMLPREGPLAAAGTVIEKTLRAVLDDYNARGGVNGRHIELDVVTAGGDISQLQRAYVERPFFALLSPVSIGMEGALTAFAEERQIPVVGSFSPANPGGQTGGQYVFDLLAGLPEQARTLIEYAVTQLKLKDPRAVLLHPGPGLYTQAIEAMSEQASQRGWKRFESSAYARGSLANAGLVKRLREQGAEVIFYLGSDAELAGFLREADRAGWYPNVLAIGADVARISLTMPAGFARKLQLVFPNQPGGSGPARNRYEQFLVRHQLDRQQITAQASAYAAAELMVEGLKRTGRTLTRTQFVNALEGVREFDTGALPPLTYSARYRIGARGGYMVTYDPAAGGFVPMSGWITLDVTTPTGG